MKEQEPEPRGRPTLTGSISSTVCRKLRTFPRDRIFITAAVRGDISPRSPSGTFGVISTSGACSGEDTIAGDATRSNPSNPTRCPAETARALPLTCPRPPHTNRATHKITQPPPTSPTAPPPAATPPPAPPAAPAAAGRGAPNAQCRMKRFGGSSSRSPPSVESPEGLTGSNHFHASRPPIHARCRSSHGSSSWPRGVGRNPVSLSGLRELL